MRTATFNFQGPAVPLSFSAPKSQRFKSQRLQDANATKSQTLAFYINRSVLVPLRSLRTRPSQGNTLTTVKLLIYCGTR